MPEIVDEREDHEEDVVEAAADERSKKKEDVVATVGKRVEESDN